MAHCLWFFCADSIFRWRLLKKDMFYFPSKITLRTGLYLRQLYADSRGPANITARTSKKYTCAQSTRGRTDSEFKQKKKKKKKNTLNKTRWIQRRRTHMYTISMHVYTKMKRLYVNKKKTFLTEQKLKVGHKVRERETRSCENWDR